MKATPTKTEAAKAARKNGPFFKKEEGQGFFKPAQTSVQPKLTVGEPDDVYEKEADATADKVVRKMNADTVSKSADKEKLNRKPIFESENDAQEGVQRKGAGAAGAKTPAVSPAVESGLRSSKGSGSALPEATKNQMESSFGTDFSGVRVHTDNAAQEMNKDLQAQAFTHGKDIYFGSGKYNPASNGGQHLLAHELTHVVQQTGTGAPEASVHRKAAGAGGVGGVAAPADNQTGLRKEPTKEQEPVADDVPKGRYSGGNGTPPSDGAPPEDPLIKRSVQRKMNAAGPTIQRDGNPGGGGPGGGQGGDPQGQQPQSDGEKLKSIKPIPEGFIRGDTTFELVITNYALKKYDDVDSTDPTGEIKKPIPGTRATKQDSVWRGAVKDTVKNNLTRVANSKDEAKTFQLSLKGGGQARGESSVIGNLDTLTSATVVAFWDKDGKPQIHQIEHVIDWQILGNAADTYNNNNLVLLDKGTNLAQGDAVRQGIEAQATKIMAYYKAQGIQDPIATSTWDYVQNKCSVFFSGFSRKAVAAKSIIQKKDVENQSDDSIFSQKTIKIQDPKIPDGYCIIKTAKSGAGFLVPYNYKQGNIEIKGIGTGAAKDHSLTSITMTRIVSPSPGVTGGETKVDLSFVKEDNDIYRMNQRGYAGTLKEALKLVGMSPIEFSDDDIEVSPLTGITADGKVKPEFALLGGADIDFHLEAGEFSVSATITSDFLKDKLPKPLSVDYSNLTITVSTKEALKVGGEIGFSIQNLGNGSLRAAAGTSGFSIGGQFTFTNAQAFKTAKLSFAYSRGTEGEGKWSGSGEIAFGKDKIPGVKSGDITLSYKDAVLTGKGSFETTVPHMDKIGVSVQVDQSGNFSITGQTSLKDVPGVKSSDISVTLTKDATGYSLAMTGTAVPNLPNVPGLGVSLTVSYDKGVFTLQGTATYKEGKLDGSITLGVTNASVDQDGKPTGGATDSLTIFGNGQLTLTLLPGATATLGAALDQTGEVFIWGKIDVNAKPFPAVNIDHTIFHITASIPLAGIPLVSVNLELGAGLRFYFNWDPLTIELHTTLERINIKDLDQAGGDLSVDLYSQAKAGIELSVDAGVVLQLVVAKVGVHAKGSVALEINTKLGAKADATWGLKSGLQLKDAEAYLNAVPSVIFKIEGYIQALIDLWVTEKEIYYKKLGSAEKQIDLSDFAFGLTVPLKIDEGGKLAGIDFDKVKLTPTFDESSGKAMTDRVMNDDDPAAKAQREQEAKDKIRQEVKSKLAAKKAEGSENLNDYANQLKSEMAKGISPTLAGFVDQVVQEELKNLGEGNVPAAAPGPPPDPNAGEGA